MLALVFLLSACASSSSLAPDEACPVTQPPDQVFVPPEGYQGSRLEAYEGFFWFGTPQLWTMLPEDATWSQLPESEGGYAQKIVWWSEGYDWIEEPIPEFHLTGRRLDGEAPRIDSREATNANTSDNGSFIITGVQIPSAGCWGISGEYQGAELSYVVEVVEVTP